MKLLFILIITIICLVTISISIRHEQQKTSVYKDKKTSKFFIKQKNLHPVSSDDNYVYFFWEQYPTSSSVTRQTFSKSTGIWIRASKKDEEELEKESKEEPEQEEITVEESEEEEISTESSTDEESSDGGDSDSGD